MRTGGARGEVIMTPAEKLSKTKVRRRKPQERKARRAAVWQCKLRDFREELDLSLKDVAGACNLTITCIFQVELGSDPMLSTARKLATFYGKTIEEIWPRLAENGEQTEG
mgnify:CR=1 FL=1